MSELGVRASHQAFMRLRRAGGGAVRGYDSGGAPDMDLSTRPPDQEPVQGSFDTDSTPTATPVGFRPINPMQPAYSNPGGHEHLQVPNVSLPTGRGEPPSGLNNLTVNGILHPDTPAQPARSRGVEDIAAELHARGQDALQSMGVPGGRITQSHPDHDEIISHALASEVQGALDRPGANAADWYSGKVREALAVASTMHPEIEADPLSKTAYTAALAITSQGETVPSNVRLAEQAYRHFKETGRFPEEVSADKGAFMGDNFSKLNGLIDSGGMQGMHDFLHSQMTARDLKGMGYASATKEKMDAPVYGSAILGPKIGGGFFQNLNGNYDPVTMDLWFMRGWGRLTGTLVGKPDMTAQKERLVNALQDAGVKVPRTQDGLLDTANSLISTHEQDFRANRQDYDSGDKAKSELTYAAERYQKALQGINETPSSGGQRAWMRDRVNRAREILGQNGTNVTNADLQALWWYPEKELYSKLGGRDAEGINVDYASVLRNHAKANGVPDDTVERAVRSAHQRPGSSGAPANDAGAGASGGEGGNRLGPAQAAAGAPPQSLTGPLSFWAEPQMRASGGRVDAAARQAHPEPTPAQAKAGNYRKGHVAFQGLPITIENARGSMRRGIGKGGKPWSVRMPAHYGYIKRTEGADGDHIDVYLGHHPLSPHVFVVNQHDADTKAFDEHKVMLGYASKAQALRDYERAFSDGRGLERAHSVIEMPIGDFKERLKNPKAFIKSIRRAAGGRAGFADGGAPGEMSYEDAVAGKAPAPTGELSYEDAVRGGQGGAASQERALPWETPKPGQPQASWSEVPGAIATAGKEAVQDLWGNIKGGVRAASAAGEGKVDLSSPEGSLLGASAASTFAGPLSVAGGASPARATGRAIAAGLEREAPEAAVTAQALARQKAADEFNVNLSRGQATADPDAIRYENLASRGAYGKPAQDVAEPFFNQQFEDLGRAGRGIGEGLARDQDVAGAPGEAAQTLNTEIGGAATRAQQLRDQAAAQAARDADATRGIVQDQGRAIGEAIQGGRPAIENPREAGELVGQQVRTAAAADRAAYQARYREATSLPGQFDAGAFQGIGTRMQEGLSQRAEPVIIDDVTTPIASRAIRDVDNISNLRIQNRADPMGAPNPDDIVGIDLRGVDQARKRLVTFYRAARGSGNASDARAAGALIDEFDNQVEGAMSNGLFSGDPQALTALQQARAAYSAYARAYRPQQSGDDVGTAMRRIIDRQATPEEIANMITGSGRLGNAGLPVRLADRLQDVLGENSDAWSAIRQALWQRASQVRNNAGEIDPARSAVSAVNFAGSTLGQRMFSPAERRAMIGHAQAVRNLDQMIEQLPSTQAAARAQTGYEAAFGGGGIGGAQQAVFRRMVAGTATPEETAQAVFNSIAGGNPGNTARLIDAIQNIAGPQSQAMAAIRQGVWQRLTQNAAGKDQPGQQRLAQAINEFLNGKGRGIARQLYSDNERFLMKRYGDVVRQTAIPPAARTNSDTTPALMNMLNRYGSAISTTIGAAAEAMSHGMFGGLVGGLAGRTVGDMIEKKAAGFREQGSASKVGKQFDWLNNVPTSQQRSAPGATPQLSRPVLPALAQSGALRQIAGPMRQLQGPVPAGAQGNQQQ